MPFTKTSEGVVWNPSNPEDVRKIREDLLNPEVEHKEKPNIELDKVLKQRIESTLSTIIPGYGLEILGGANTKLYKFIKDNKDQSREPVDILIPVHNAIHIAEKCIEAAATRTFYPHRITIIDDASDSKTKSILRGLQEKYPTQISLLINKKNRGFAATINKGIRLTSNPYIVLLNSDVLVTPYWLTKMMLALKDHPRNMIVNPATNNTALIDVPLSPGCNYLIANKIFEKYSHHNYPEIMPTGFCFLFPRSLIAKIGFLDEAYKNFGEESHMWMQTITYTDGSDYPRYRAVMADDTYCFHERGSSFAGKEDEMEHMSIRKTASSRFHKIWPQYSHWRKSYSVDKALGNLKSVMPSNMINEESESPNKICWVVRATRSRIGAMKYISDIVNEINERGGDARVAHVLKSDVESDKLKIEVLPELRTAPIVFNNDKEFVERFEELGFSKGIIVASTVELAGIVKELTDKCDKLKPLLHVQSYEPMMTTDTKVEFEYKQAYKLIPNVISSSKWITETLINEKIATPFNTISPGVDQKLFYIRNRDSGDERPTVMVPINKEYPYRGGERAVSLIKALIKQSKKLKQEIRILCPGVDVVQNADFTIAMGNLAQTRMAKVLGTEVDIFVDPSHIHSYGLPCLEAIASGVFTISWDNKGINEYLKPNNSCGFVIPDDWSMNSTASFILEKLKSIQTDKDMDNVNTNCEDRINILKEHDRETSVNEFITSVEDKFNASSVKKTKRIVFITPHMRKWGGPTTIIGMANEMAARGHNVSITSVYSDINPSVVEQTDLPINLNPHEIPKCDVLITNSDNPMNNVFINSTHAKKKVMFKMSHNPRFKQLEDDSLKLNWDAIVTTTDWLAEACKNPIPSWGHPPKDATRIGWYHYGHNTFSVRPEERKYGDAVEHQIVISTLVHRHPLKGTQEALSAMQHLYRKYEGKLNFIGIGEVPLRSGGQPVFKPPSWMTYVFSPTRDELANYLRQTDIWIGASHTEGLGRLALEAMSSSVACVLTNTGAEFAVDNENCLLVPINNPKVIVDKIEYLIANPEIRTRIQRNAHATSTIYADPTDCVDKLESVIEGLFSERKS